MAEDRKENLAFKIACAAVLVMVAFSSSYGRCAAAEVDRHGSFPWSSPDGKYVVFASSRDAEISTVKSAWLSMHIYRMSSDGSEVQRLTNSSTSDTAPVWTPDGKWIIFGTMDSKIHQETLDIMRPDGSLRHTILSGHFLPWVRISPDSRKVAFTVVDAAGKYSVDTANIDGSNQQAVATGLKMAWDGIWSPDSRHFVFAERPPDPEKNLTPPKSDIYIADANGDNRRLLATYRGFLQVPAWSPDGDSIAYQTYTGDEGTADIVLLNVATGKFRTASHRSRAYLDETPAWRPDGRLLLQSTREGPFEIYEMEADGSGARSLTGGAHKLEK
jgi:Tol biopolymer transport system component